MITRITADNGIEIEVCEPGLSVIDHEDQTETWVRLTPEQRRALVDALDPQREGWNLADLMRLRKTLADPTNAVRRERDAAVARADQLRDERDKALSAGLEALGDAERDRDEWKASAERAGKRGDDWEQRAHEWMKRAETVSAVTRADIEKTVADWADDAPEIVNEVWSLVSGDDPAIYVVRESDVAAVEVRREGSVLYAGDWVVRTDMYVEEEWRDKADRYRRSLAETEAVIRAIEDGQADPVEEKARELYEHVYVGRFENGSSGVQAEYRKLAAHVLGQEATR